MLCKRMIPCLDVHGGRVVKGVRFADLRDAGDPVEAALAYDAQGADELVFLDITASHEERAIMLDVVRRTAEGIYMPLTVGGGIRSIEDIRTLLRAGAGTIIYTDIARDGTQGGPNVWSTEAVARAAGIPVFASGGVGSLEDIRQLAAVPGVEGVIVGRALYTGAVSLRAALAEAR